MCTGRAFAFLAHSALLQDAEGMSFGQWAVIPVPTRNQYEHLLVHDDDGVSENRTELRVARFDHELLKFIYLVKAIDYLSIIT